MNVVLTGTDWRFDKKSEMPGLVLAFRHTHNQTVEVWHDFDLTGQAAVRLKFLREIEHGFLHVRLRRNLFLPCRVDVHMTGRAGAGPSAICVDSGDEILHGALHHGPTFGHLDLMLFP